MMSKRYNDGYLLVLVLIFGTIFFVGLTAFSGYVITQSQVQRANYESARALEIAEAGLDYYKWYLAHNPGDVTNGTGEAGPYVHEYADPEGGVIGEFSLEVASSTVCGEVYAVDIYSTGSTSDAPDRTRTVYARYAQPTVGEYAYIINSNVWAGEDRTIIGPYHSNGVVRMDGTNNSTVTSGQEDWVCDGSLPCDPYSTGTTLDGVYGDGPNSALWTFPHTPINFTGLSVDLSNMQDAAENSGGIHLEPSGEYGYRIVFASDSTIDVYAVDEVHTYEGYTSESGWETERNVIDDDDWVGSYDIAADCPLIFVEDKVWLEGELVDKVTIAAADLSPGGSDPSIILNGDITYVAEGAGLLAVAEEDVLVGLTVPNEMELNGIFVAQNGRFGRNHYDDEHLPRECTFWFIFCWSWDTLFEGYITRDTLTINGTIVSNGRVGTKWTSGGIFTSGFETRYNAYDRDLVSDPPPLTPETSDTYEFIEWREVEPGS